MSDMTTAFQGYCRDFYCNDPDFRYRSYDGTLVEALYPLAPGAVIDAACTLVAMRKDIPFDGDSTDREKVRELLEQLGYEEGKETS
jgi:hypothetical protein